MSPAAIRGIRLASVETFVVIASCHSSWPTDPQPVGRAKFFLVPTAGRPGRLRLNDDWPEIRHGKRTFTLSFLRKDMTC
jgi:hypothetical protein